MFVLYIPDFQKMVIYCYVFEHKIREGGVHFENVTQGMWDKYDCMYANQPVSTYTTREDGDRSIYTLIKIHVITITRW